jgi:hypothetical protein
VNVYLPKSLIARIDKRAAELGMSRSSLFGFAATHVLELGPGVARIPFVGPRSKAHKTGALRAEKRPRKTPAR